MRSGSTPIARVAQAAIARPGACRPSDRARLRLAGFARVVGLAIAAGLSASAESRAQFGQVAFDVRAPFPPTPFAADSRTHLVYELRITNTASSRRSLRQLDVLGRGASPLLSIGGAELRRSATLVGSGRSADPTVLEPGRQALVMVWVALPEAGPVPDRLSHRFIVSPPDSLDAERADTLDGPVLGTSGLRVAELSPPLVGGPWVAVNGPSNRSGHRITVLAVGGEARVPQRFASDWIKLGADGRLARGDSTVNANWHGYGEPVLAVADGVVVASGDGIGDNTPYRPGPARPITLETVGGNHVILGLQDGTFAVYAHLAPGTVQVRVGDRVRRGQVIGRLGNSGNSGGPHLHFHVSDRPSLLEGEGLPFVFREFELLGRAEGVGLRLFEGPGWRARTDTPELRQAELPLENAVVRFTDGRLR
jgi:murein DD-endopeptidase